MGKQPTTPSPSTPNKTPTVTKSISPLQKLSTRVQVQQKLQTFNTMENIFKDASTRSSEESQKNGIPNFQLRKIHHEDLTSFFKIYCWGAQDEYLPQVLEYKTQISTNDLAKDCVTLQLWKKDVDLPQDGTKFEIKSKHISRFSLYGEQDARPSLNLRKDVEFHPLFLTFLYNHS